MEKTIIKETFSEKIFAKLHLTEFCDVLSLSKFVVDTITLTKDFNFSQFDYLILLMLQANTKLMALYLN